MKESRNNFSPPRSVHGRKPYIGTCVCSCVFVCVCVSHTRRSRAPIITDHTQRVNADRRFARASFAPIATRHSCRSHATHTHIQSSSRDAHHISCFVDIFISSRDVRVSVTHMIPPVASTLEVLPPSRGSQM